MTEAATAETLPETTQPGGALTHAGVPSMPTGLQGLDRSDFIIPRITIVQPTSEEGNAGTFRLNLDGEEFKEISFVVIKVSRGRVLFDEDRAKGAPLCGSPDRILPSPQIENPMAASCKECALSKWTKQNGHKNAPPKCNETYTLLCLEIETLIPFFLQTKGTSIQPTKMLLSALAMKCNFQAHKGTNAETCDFKITAKLKEVKNDKGKYYVPVFGTPEFLKDTPFRELAGMYIHEEPGFDTVDASAEQGKGPDSSEDIPF